MQKENLCLATVGSPIAGFARFLHLLSQHPWRDRPLVVDPSAELTPPQHKRIQATFDAAKAAGGVRGFTVCTPSDMEGSAWGQEGVTSAMRQRLVKLAGKSLDVLKVRSPNFVFHCRFYIIACAVSLKVGMSPNLMSSRQLQDRTACRRRHYSN